MQNLQISVENIPDSELKPKYKSEDNIGFGQIKTDRMFTASYKEGSWQDLTISKYAPIILDPTAVCFHYGQTIFEGQKAFRTQDGHINLFRPEENAARFNLSAKRMMMPEIDPEIYLSGLKKLLILEKDWAPKSEGSTIYIRPAMIGTEPSIGLRASNEYLFFIILFPSKSYFPEILKIYVSEQYIRAAPGGIGSAKTGGNYGGSLFVGQQAKDKGYDAVLWLDAIHRRYVEEVGAMNIFFVFNEEIYTTPLESDTIVHGITRDSAIKILRDFGYTVREEALPIDKIIRGLKEGTLTESFGTGTAASIVPVGSLYYQEADHIINNFQIGTLTKKLTERLLDIQYGNIEDPYGWIVRVV
ncbi:MAG: branched-chain amino acid aminotransferase [Candidatus Hodarchaeales archaeon]|jgi:branched-chain amino acid aminotransferase